MDVLEAIAARRSVRKYKKGAAVPKEDIEKMLDAAMHAPSAVNSRPWEFYCSDKEEVKSALMAVHPSCRMLETASWVIAVCARPDLQPGRGFWQQDCGAAIENILLAAKNLGYGTCWCGCYPAQPRADEVQKVLACASVPIALIAVGVPDEEPSAKGFYDSERVHFI